MSGKSEFGRGIVICLAKFSEHLWQGPFSEQFYELWKLKEGKIKESDLSGFTKTMLDMENERTMQGKIGEAIYGGEYPAIDRAISHSFTMWMNAASDHMYDLDESAPKPLQELASLTLSAGHGFKPKLWTIDDFHRMKKLWEESCIEVDKMLGIKNPDWGEY